VSVGDLQGKHYAFGTLYFLSLEGDASVMNGCLNQQGCPSGDFIG
jgi:hypothetical protein